MTRYDFLGLDIQVNKLELYLISLLVNYMNFVKQ